MRPLIELRDITKVYGSNKSITNALNRINLTINKGEFLAIMGPSGSGKSTLMHILGLLDDQSSGSYYFDGRDQKNLNLNTLAKLRNEKIGFIFQDYALIKKFNVLENVILPLTYRKTPKNDMKKVAMKLLNQLNMDSFINRYPDELSGGQQQRVAIARALVGNPSLILADEPTGALDQKTGEEIIDILAEVSRQEVTVVIVTHDINVAQKCDKIITMKDGEIV